MLEFLGEADAAARIRKALDDVIASNPPPTSIGDLVAGRV
jgi:isocitrate/isopropylmalate dehydrogenase